MIIKYERDQQDYLDGSDLEADEAELEELEQQPRPIHQTTAIYLEEALEIGGNVTLGYVAKRPRPGRSYPERAVFVMGGRSTSIWIGNEEEGFIPLARGPMPPEIQLSPHFFRPARSRSLIYIGGYLLRLTEAVTTKGYGLIVDIESLSPIKQEVLPASEVLYSAPARTLAIGQL